MSDPRIGDTAASSLFPSFHLSLIAKSKLQLLISADCLHLYTCTSSSSKLSYSNHATGLLSHLKLLPFFLSSEMIQQMLNSSDNFIIWINQTNNFLWLYIGEHIFILFISFVNNFSLYAVVCPSPLYRTGFKVACAVEQKNREIRVLKMHFPRSKWPQKVQYIGSDHCWSV